MWRVIELYKHGSKAVNWYHRYEDAKRFYDGKSAMPPSVILATVLVEWPTNMILEGVFHVNTHSIIVSDIGGLNRYERELEYDLSSYFDRRGGVAISQRSRGYSGSETPPSD